MAGGQLTRRTMALTGLASAGLPSLSLASPSLASPQEAPEFAGGGLGGGLLTVPVTIDDQGPFTFAIDSAANASVIAEDLAVRLGLPAAGEVTMHTLVAREVAPTVRASRMRTGALDARGVRLVVTGRSGLDGLDGLLGTDLLADLRLVLRFGRRTRASVSRPRLGGEYGFDGVRLDARASGEQRFNGLLLIDALAGQVPCKVIVDTGAKVTIINTALAKQADAQPLVLAGSSESRVYSPTGRAAVAEAMLLPAIRLGGVRFSRVPVLVGDFHTFGLWGLADQPALLLGVDLLGLFHTVIIDLKRGELLLDP
jgi:predicted aspartyl protease